ncbi:hypothetical protein L1987_81649 [Smallanthus sonchifolius]|uniref:Uncharacterized protein n=1 Tax=Smallanthus sonchifolius TaxID=185202 RepID=A0ACB8YQB6_9ASTR|nr:hypothetical protein L1987_81649 [Smallanthus sonchifolius]
MGHDCLLHAPSTVDATSSWFMIGAKLFIEVYEKRSDMNPTILELAKLDFDMVQVAHIEVLKHTSRWRRNTSWDKKLTFARDRLVVNFLWTVACFESVASASIEGYLPGREVAAGVDRSSYGYLPRFSLGRRNLTKVNAMITMIDDVNDVYGRRLQGKARANLKDAVKKMIHNVGSPMISTLELVDDLQRLGIAYHFGDELRNLVEVVYNNYYKNRDKWNRMDLNLKALGFRLLRQHGYQVPQEIFHNFKDTTQNLKPHSLKDMMGMLNLWWRDTRWVTKLSFIRDSLVSSFLWAIGLGYQPHYSLGRDSLAKAVAMITGTDDIYDENGTLDELEKFIDIVDRWDIEELPDYMKICFIGFYNTINEISYSTFTNTGILILLYIKKACHMHESGATEEEARGYIKEMIRDAWKKLNKERALANSQVSREYIEYATNMARMAQFMYGEGDGHGRPEIIKSHISSLIFNPIQVTK